MKRTFALGIFLALLAATASGTPIQIDNPGFEDFPLDPGQFSANNGTCFLPECVFSTNPIPSWFVGSNPSAGTIRPLSGTTEGVNAAYTTSTIFADGSLSQTVGSLLTEGIYTLEVDVGKLAGQPFNYVLEFLSLGDIIGQHFNVVDPDPGNFLTATLTMPVTPGTFPFPYIGNPFDIRLRTFGGSVLFDSVQLTFIPEPSTALLLATGLAGLAGVRRRAAA